MNKFGFERDDLNFICPSRVLNSIAGEIVDDWPMVGQALDVSTEKLKSIPQDPSHSSPKQKAAAMLDAWAKEKGREATCLELAKALHKCRKISTLEKFCEEVKPEVEKRRDMTTLSAQQISTLEKFCEEVKPEVEKRRDMTTLPAQLERDLLLKEQKTPIGSFSGWPKLSLLSQQPAHRSYRKDTKSYPTFSRPSMFYSKDSDRSKSILSHQRSVSSGYSSPYYISPADQQSKKFKVLEVESEAIKLALAVGDMRVSLSKVARRKIEPTNKPYKMEQTKHRVNKSGLTENPFAALLNEEAMNTGVTRSDSKEASSEQPPKEKASSSKSTAESSYALQQSTFFQEARTRAKIPFLHHQVLECDSSGQEFNIIEHDTTVEIPKGCVSEGEKLCLEVGVAMYGPFKFTDDSQPISPILWICFLNEDVKVNKPIKITVPHFLTELTENRLREHRVSFAKANHSTYSPQEDYIVYNFQPSEDKTQFISRNDKSYGVLETTHCCYLCIQAKKTPLLDKDAGYRLARVERISPRGNDIHFAATYRLKTCCKALEEQYPNEDGYIISYKNFKFEAETLKVTVPENDDKYIFEMDPLSAEILASDIDFWSKGFSDMRFEHDKKMYPPRVKMEVILKTKDPLTIVMKFSGSLNDRQLDVKIALADVKAGNRKRGKESESEETVRQMLKVVKSGPIKDPDCLFSDMSKDIGDKYMEVGIFLGLPYRMLRNELETVQFNTLPVNKKAMKMLHLWKDNTTEGDLTYSKLAAALEKNRLIRCADDHCYTTATASEQ